MDTNFAKKSPSSKIPFPKQILNSNSIKSLDFRASLSINSVKNLSNQANGKMGHFFSPKASLEFKTPLFQQQSHDSSLPKKKPELISPQLYFISKQKISKPEESKVQNFKGVLSEIYNKDIFNDDKKQSMNENRKNESLERNSNNENSAVEKPIIGSGRVELNYRGQLLKIFVENPEEKTFSWLKTKLINEIVKCEQEKGTKIEANNLPINGFSSKDGFYLIDFALHSIGDWNLGFLKNKKIGLIPLFKENKRIDFIPKNRQSLKQYDLLKVIGSGGFSQVILGRKKDTRRMYALKIIRREFIHKNEKESIIMNEINILKSCNNQFIVHLESAFKTRKYLIFVMDFCAGGEFFCLLKRKKRIKEDEARLYFIELCLGIEYLHRRNIIYRDIKPENILLDLDGHLKIADFGLAKPNMDESMLAYSFCGSPEYMAPEMLRKNGHNFCVDIYCLGTFLYELVVGIPPFYSTNTKEMFQCILKKNIMIPDTINLSPEIKNLLKSLLEKNPEKRLGFHMGVAEIFQHPWCLKANIKAIANKKLEPPFKPNLFEFYFDEVSNQDLLEELEKEYDENITEIYDEEDFTDQLNEFHYVYIDNSKTHNNHNLRPMSGPSEEQNSSAKILKTSVNTHIQQTTTQPSLKNSPFEYKSVSSSNFEEFLTGMTGMARNVSNDNVNKLGMDNNYKKQISINLGFNKMMKETEKKPELILHATGLSSTNILQHEKKPENNKNNNYVDIASQMKLLKNQAFSTKNVSAKHFNFDQKQEGAKTYENLDEVALNVKGIGHGNPQKNYGNFNFKGSALDNANLKKNNKLFQEIHASINRQLLQKNSHKFQKTNSNIVNMQPTITQQEEPRFGHVSSSQNLHETLARLNAKKTEQQNQYSDMKRKTLSGNKKTLTEH